MISREQCDAAAQRYIDSAGIVSIRVLLSEVDDPFERISKTSPGNVIEYTFTKPDGSTFVSRDYRGHYGELNGTENTPEAATELWEDLVDSWRSCELDYDSWLEWMDREDSEMNRRFYSHDQVTALALCEFMGRENYEGLLREVGERPAD